MNKLFLKLTTYIVISSFLYSNLVSANPLQRETLACKSGCLRIDLRREFAAAYTARKRNPPKASEENIMYINGKIVDGRRIGGEKIGSVTNKNQLPKYIARYPDMIVENVRLDQYGGLHFHGNNGNPYWQGKRGYEKALVTAEVKGGKLVAVYDKNGNKIYPQELKENYVYINGKIKDGKRNGGKLIGPVIKNQLSSFIKKHSDCIIEKFRLNGHGGFQFCGKIYWTALKGYKNAFVTVEVRDGKPVAVYDKDGNKLYPTEDLIYINAKIKDGKRAGGNFVCRAAKKKLSKLLKKYPDAIIENVKLDKRGGFHFMGKPYWQILKGYEYALVTVVVKKGKLEAVYDKDGKKLFPYESGENIIYINGKIVGGKIRGKKSLCLPNKQSIAAFVRRHPNIVIENFRLGGKGEFFFNGKTIWGAKKGFENALVIVEVENREIKSAYTKTGEKIYPSQSKENLVYVGAKVKNGKRDGGTLLGPAGSRKKLLKLLKKYPAIVIENVKLFSNGGFIFNGMPFWGRTKGYENAYVTIEGRKGKITGIYGKNGNQLYPIKSEKHHIYTGAKIIDGKRTGGRQIASAKNRKDLLKYLQKYPNAIVENVELNARGGFYFTERLWESMRGYENALVTVEFVNGEIEAVYDQEGKKLYQAENGKGLQIFDKLWREGDIEKLMLLFGVEGSSRILLRFFDCFTPKSLLSHTRRFIESLPRYKREKILNKKKHSIKPEDALKIAKSIKIFQDKTIKTDLETASEEFIRLIYPYLVKDYRFLETLKKESEDSKISAFLRQCYKNAVRHYKNADISAPRGIQTSTELKFYQKLGIQFILEKKKVLLADEPGLGKTLQALGACVNAYSGRGAKKVLILCPHISKINVWEKQIAEHLRGEQEVMIVNERKSLDSAHGAKKAKESRFIIANYELIRGKGGRNTLEKLKALGIDFIIVDEAHRIRNDTEITRAVCGLDAPYKVLVTGTPLVGRDPARLFNLLNWLYPNRYPDKKSFYKTYRKPGGYRQLRDEMKDFMLRRYVSDVLVDMPKLNIELRPVRMGKDQTAIYRQIEENIYRDRTVPLIAQIDLLKRAAVDTALIRRIKFTDTKTGIVTEVRPGSHDIVIGKTKYGIIPGENGEFTLVQDTKRGKQHKQNVKDGDTITPSGRQYKIDMSRRMSLSAKYRALDEIVNDVVKDKNQKLVIFTGMIRTVKDLRKRYEEQGFEVVVMYGQIGYRDREKIINEFNSSEKPVIFICTYQTGGESIDLSGANVGVLVDEPWTVQEKDQIVRRLYRLGQKNEVTFYILEALKTIDERIEEVLMEGDFLQKIILDDPNWAYNSQHEIIQRFLAQGTNSSEDLLKLKQLQEKVRVQTKGADELVLHNMVKAGNLYVRFKDKKFGARLRTQNGKVIEIASVSELLSAAKDLSNDSKELLKQFFAQRFNSERQAKTKVKDMILWHICEELIPGFKDIDYHGKLELIIEIGTHVLRRIIEDPNVDIKRVLNELGDTSEKLFEEAMYYLDSSNILKLFSLIGAIPQSYYYNGQLLKYTPPIKVYYQQSGIQYFDLRFVEGIAPGWQVPEKEISGKLSGFTRDACKSRILERSEEIRLAHQLEQGNKAAEIVLVSSHLRDILPIAKRVKRHLINKFGKRFAGSIEVDEMCGAGRMILLDLINSYAKYGAYETQPLSDYLRKRLNPGMYTWGYRIIKDKMELTADNPAGENTPTQAERLSTPPVGSANIENEETGSLIRSLLHNNGFTDTEIEIILLFVFEGYTEHELVGLVKQTSKNLGEKDITAIIARFRKTLLGIGKGRLLRLLHDPDSKIDRSA